LSEKKKKEIIKEAKETPKQESTETEPETPEPED
jgi:hypothetical protein